MALRLLFAATSLLVVGLAVWAASDWYIATPRGALAEAKYVGRESCAQCHQQETAAWTGSHHDRAMEIASAETVLGDFDDVEFTRFGVVTRMFRRDGQYFVNAEGPDGEHRDYHVKWTFGVEPLQQYMVELDDGRVQVLRIAWDTRKNEWFYVAPIDARDERLLPGDPLHWTGMAQNWNTMCAECHSTNLRKNYDHAANAYHTEYSEIDVSCEACHGPGSVHVELAESSSLFWDRNVGYGLTNNMKGVDNNSEIETCAPCHSRRVTIDGQYRHGDDYHNGFHLQLLEPGLYHADGQILDEVYVYGSFLQSKMYHKNVRCSDCHQPHSLKLKYEGNQLCAQCHQPGKYDTPAHHHHDSPAAQSAGATLCVNCHMISRTYMEIDDRRDHSFRIPRPDLSVDLGTPNACNDCHDQDDEDAAWAAEKIIEWYGPDRPDDPHYGPVLAALRNNDPNARQLGRELLSNPRTPDIVRATALTHLAGQADRRWVGEALTDENPLIRAAAAEALTPPPSREAFAAASRDPSATRQLREQRALFVDDLAPLLEDKVRMVRMAAATQLVRFADTLGQSGFKEQLDAAVEEYRAGQELHLDRAGSHRNLAQLNVALGNLPKAIESLRNAIRQEDYLSGLRGELARLIEQVAREKTGQVSDEVAAEIRRLRTEEAELLLRDQTLLPQAAGPHYQRGMLLYLLGRGDEARKELLEACKLGPNDYQNWLALALLCQQQERYDQALQALERMAQLRPNSPDVRNIYIQIQQAQQQEQGAQKSQ